MPEDLRGDTHKWLDCKSNYAHSKISKIMEIGKVYKLDNELIRLEKIHKNGIHVFKVVDQFGNEVVKRKGNVIIDYGDRIVRKRLDKVQEVDGSEFNQLNLF